MWWRPPRCSPRCAASRLEEIAAADHREFLPLFSKVPRPSAAIADKLTQSAQTIRMTLQLHHPRLRLVRRRAAAGARLGRLRSEQSEEPPPALLAAGRAARRRRASRAMLVDTSPDLREQLLDANVDWVDAVLFTHEHADHTHGIDDLRGLFITGASACRSGSMSAASHAPARSLRLLLHVAARQRLSADRERAPHGARQAGHGRRAGRHPHGAADPAGPWRHHLARLPLRAAGLFLRPQRACRRTAWRRWKASTSGSSMRCATSRIRRHLSVSEALDWIERLKPTPRDPDQPAHRPRL